MGTHILRLPHAASQPGAPLGLGQLGVVVLRARVVVPRGPEVHVTRRALGPLLVAEAVAAAAAGVGAVVDPPRLGAVVDDDVVLEAELVAHSVGTWRRQQIRGAQVKTHRDNTQTQHTQHT